MAAGGGRTRYGHQWLEVSVAAGEGEQESHWCDLMHGAG
jgi:hypothetical protein